MGLEPGYFPGAFTPLPLAWLDEQNLTAEQFVVKYNQSYHRQPGQRWNFLPCTDDRPFFVDCTFGIPVQFRRFMWALGLATLLLSAGAWLWLKRANSPVLARSRFWPAVVYFALLGMGFMALEIVLAQKLVLLLGYPVLTLSVVLFSLLLGGGLGSFTTQSWPEATVRKRATAAALGVVVMAVALYLLLPSITTAALHLDIRLRCALTMALLVPLGFCLGIPFPTGIRTIGSKSGDLVPWMWGVNGLTSVIGSVGAMVMAKLIGFSSVLLLGSGLYALVAIILASGLLSQRSAKVK